MWSKRWLERLEGRDHTAVSSALTAVSNVPPGQPISAGVARDALAASEVVAAGTFRPQIQALRSHARAAVERIRKDGPKVDPDDQWDEPDGATEASDADSRAWRTQMDLLALRLSD